jgi:hypothetical protein
MPPTSQSFDTLLEIIRAEFREMPGMCLTPDQFRRLWHLDEELCEALTHRLLDDGYLGLDGLRRLRRSMVTL